MGKKDYTKYSEQSENTVEEVTNEVQLELPVVDTVIDEVVEEVINEVVYKNAIVTGCVKLNVRKEPSKNAEIVCVLEEFTEVTVEETLPTDEFYKISTSVNGVLVEGYCMKKFINIK